METQVNGPDEGGARSPLERELYWAEEATPRSRMDIGGIRNALRDLTALLRADQKVGIPRGEPHLTDPIRWRRRVKLGMFRFLRPVSKRYDRLLGDLAELSAALADRVAELESEVTRLRQKAGDDG